VRFCDFFPNFEVQLDVRFMITKEIQVSNGDATHKLFQLELCFCWSTALTIWNNTYRLQSVCEHKSQLCCNMSLGNLLLDRYTWSARKFSELLNSTKVELSPAGCAGRNFGTKPSSSKASEKRICLRSSGIFRTHHVVYGLLIDKEEARSRWNA
jgi:hypothetical protein